MHALPLSPTVPQLGPPHQVETCNINPALPTLQLVLHPAVSLSLHEMSRHTHGRDPVKSALTLLHFSTSHVRTLYLPATVGDSLLYPVPPSPLTTRTTLQLIKA